MKPNIIKYKEFLKFFTHLSPHNKQHFIPSLRKEHLNTISEICKKNLKCNLTQDPKIISKVKSARNEIKTISLKSTPLYKKKKILQSRRGGAILSVLLPLAASLITSLFTRKS